MAEAAEKLAQLQLLVDHRQVIKAPELANSNRLGLGVDVVDLKILTRSAPDTLPTEVRKDLAPLGGVTLT